MQSIIAHASDSMHQLNCGRSCICILPCSSTPSLASGASGCWPSLPPCERAWRPWSSLLGSVRACLSAPSPSLLSLASSWDSLWASSCTGRKQLYYDCCNCSHLLAMTAPLVSSLCCILELISSLGCWLVSSGMTPTYFFRPVMCVGIILH